MPSSTMHTIETVGLGVITFVSTNVDDFFLLLAFFADGRSKKRQVVLGQYLGMGALVILSLAVASGTVFLPRGWISYLGIIPLLIGVRELSQMRKPGGPEKRQHLVDTAIVSRRSSLAVAGITIASGADNIGVYVPLFATMRGPDLGIIAVTFSILIAVWCAITYWMVKTGHTILRQERWLKFITPIVLILIGLWILSGIFRRELN